MTAIAQVMENFKETYNSQSDESNKYYKLFQSIIRALDHLEYSRLEDQGVKDKKLNKTKNNY